MASRGWGMAGKVLTTLLVVALAVAAMAAWQIVRHGVSARDQPWE